jgi:hypothetical protein
MNITYPSHLVVRSSRVQGYGAAKRERLEREANILLRVIIMTLNQTAHLWMRGHHALGLTQVLISSPRQAQLFQGHSHHLASSAAQRTEAAH